MPNLMLSVVDFQLKYVKNVLNVLLVIGGYFITLYELVMLICIE